MLPGFRALLAAIVLTFAVVVFSLGAAALLRVSHEQSASLPALRVPEAVAAARPKPLPPTLALLSVETDAPERTPPITAAPDLVPPSGAIATAGDASQQAEQATAPPEQPPPPADHATDAPRAVTALATDAPSPDESPAPSAGVAAAPPLAVGPAAAVTTAQAEVQVATLSQSLEPAGATAAASPVDVKAVDTPPVVAPVNAAETGATDLSINPSPAASPDAAQVTTAAVGQSAPAADALPPPVAIEGPVPLPKSRAMALAHPAPRVVRPRKRNVARRSARPRPAARAAPVVQPQSQPFPGLFPFQ